MSTIYVVEATKVIRGEYSRQFQAYRSYSLALDLVEKLKARAKRNREATHFDYYAVELNERT